MCKKIFVITKECEDHGHELEAEMCWRQCPGHAGKCGDGLQEWNTHCEATTVLVDLDDHSLYSTLVCREVDICSSDLCGLCQRSGADHDLAAEQVEQIELRQIDVDIIQEGIRDLEDLEPQLTDAEASRLVQLRYRLEQCNEQILGHENRRSELELNARNSHAASVRNEALDRVLIPGDPDRYYYGHQTTRRDGYDPEGAQAPACFPPEEFLPGGDYPDHYILRGGSFFAPYPNMDEPPEGEEEFHGHEDVELYQREHRELYGHEHQE